MVCLPGIDPLLARVAPFDCTRRCGAGAGAKFVRVALTEPVHRQHRESFGVGGLANSSSGC